MKVATDDSDQEASNDTSAVFASEKAGDSKYDLCKDNPWKFGCRLMISMSNVGTSDTRTLHHGQPRKDCHTMVARCTLRPQ